MRGWLSWRLGGPLIPGGIFLENEDDAEDCEFGINQKFIVLNLHQVNNPHRLEQRPGLVRSKTTKVSHCSVNEERSYKTIVIAAFSCHASVSCSRWCRERIYHVLCLIQNHC